MHDRMGVYLHGTYFKLKSVRCYVGLLLFLLQSVRCFPSCASFQTEQPPGDSADYYFVLSPSVLTG